MLLDYAFLDKVQGIAATRMSAESLSTRILASVHHFEVVEQYGPAFDESLVKFVESA